MNPTLTNMMGPAHVNGKLVICPEIGHDGTISPFGGIMETAMTDAGLSRLAVGEDTGIGSENYLGKIIRHQRWLHYEKAILFDRIVHRKMEIAPLLEHHAREVGAYVFFPPSDKPSSIGRTLREMGDAISAIGEGLSDRETPGYLSPEEARRAMKEAREAISALAGFVIMCEGVIGE